MVGRDDGQDGNHAASGGRCAFFRSVVAHDDRRSLEVRLGTYWVDQIDHPDLSPRVSFKTVEWRRGSRHPRAAEKKKAPTAQGKSGPWSEVSGLKPRNEQRCPRRRLERSIPSGPGGLPSSPHDSDKGSSQAAVGRLRPRRRLVFRHLRALLPLTLGLPVVVDFVGGDAPDMNGVCYHVRRAATRRWRPSSVRLLGAAGAELP